MAGLEDDWDFSPEELKLLEQDVMRKIAERKSSCTTAGASCHSNSVAHLSPRASASVSSPWHASPSRTFLESRYGKALDGEENKLQVTSTQTISSPTKQKILNYFLKRCPCFPTAAPKMFKEAF